MLRKDDFRTIQVQASIFTSGITFRGGKVFAHLLTQYSDRLDGEPVAMPIPAEFPPEVPHIILKSADSGFRLQAAPGRLDLFREAENLGQNGMREFLVWAMDVFTDYSKFLQQVRVGRIACLCSRVANGTNPAREIAEQFCRDQWLAGPLNRPASFEIHTHKRFRFADQLEVNSWFRCKSAILTPGQGLPGSPVVVIEQDFNTLAEQIETTRFEDAQIRQFFEGAPEELDRVVQLYFPGVANDEPAN